MSSDPVRVSVTINGHEVSANEGELLIDVAERHGVYIPRFCYHKRMTPVGMCRMCLVNVEGPRGPMLQPSCMVSVTDGLCVDTEAPEVKKAQDGVLEFLLANHPLDCPVCDKAGECPLQDQTVAFGPGESRFVEEKRHFEKPIRISDLVLLDRERCILCDRCTRFAKEVAGDPLIHFQSRGNQTQVNTFPEHPFASYFSGNTVQLCPVGALTSVPYRFQSRPWDLQSAESTCTTCAVGCRIAVQTSNNEISRYIGLDADEVNQGWLCDKGRYGYGALRSPARLVGPQLRAENGEWQAVSWSQAFDEIASKLQAARAGRVAFLGGSRMPLEDQYVWSRFLRSVVRTDFIDAQMGDGVDGLVVAGLPRATIDQACNAKTVILMAPDLKEIAPVMYLRLRAAVQQQSLSVIEIGSAPTSFTPLASAHVTCRPGEMASAVASLIDRGTGKSRDAGGATQSQIHGAREILGKPGEVVVIYGRANLAESQSVVSETVGLLANFTNASFLPILRRNNTNGAIDMGLTNGLLPGRVRLEDGARWYRELWGEVAPANGGGALQILQSSKANNIDVLFVSGADPLTDFPDRNLAETAISSAPYIVAIDTHENATNSHAHIRLPAAAFGERDGSTANCEGRISLLAHVVDAPGTCLPDWMIASELATRLSVDLGYTNTSDIWAEIERDVPMFRGISRAYLQRNANTGVVAPLSIEERANALHESGDDGSAHLTIATPVTCEHAVKEVTQQPKMEGDEVRLVTTSKLYDGGVLVANVSHFAKLPQLPTVRANSSTMKSAGFEDGDLVKVVSTRASVVAPVQCDDSIARGIVVFPYNLSQPAAAEFIDASTIMTTVQLEKP